MRNCVVLFCGSSLHSPLPVVAVLLWFFVTELQLWIRWIDHLPSPSPRSFPCPFVIEARVKTRPLIIPTAYYLCFPIICLSLSPSLSSRFSDYLFEFRQVCFQLVDVFICLALTLFSFGQLIALVLLLSFVLCLYFPLLFSLLFRYMSLLQVCLGYQFYLRCKFVP